MGNNLRFGHPSLSVKHPTKDEMITVESEPPKEYPWANLHIRQSNLYIILRKKYFLLAYNVRSQDTIKLTLI